MDAHHPGGCLARAGLCLQSGENCGSVVRCSFAEESAPHLDEEGVGDLPSRWCMLHQSCVGLLAISPGCASSPLFQRNHSQLCLYPLFTDFLSQGVSQQMLRLAKIPNSRCLAKIKTNRGKRIKIPRPMGPSSVEPQLLTPAPRRLWPVLLPTRWPRRGGREGAGHDRAGAPTQAGGTDLQSEAGREGRKHQLNFLEANLV